MAKLTSTTYNSINEINRSQLEKLNSVNNTYFTRDFLFAFESSNPTIDFKYILIEKEKKAIALALIQTVQLSIDVVLKNTKMPSFIRRFIYSLFCNDNINIMFCGNIFLSGEHGILIKDSENKTEVIRAICSKINVLAKLKKPLHAIFIKDFLEESRAHTDYFQKCGFTPMHVEPNMIIKIKKELN